MQTMSSSPQPVPNSAKSTAQDFHSLGSSYSNRWKRSSPDPQKMMGRSPNIMDANAKRVLSTTPSRKGSYLSERVGSPSLSGYPVSKTLNISIFKIQRKQKQYYFLH